MDFARSARAGLALPAALLLTLAAAAQDPSYLADVEARARAGPALAAARVPPRAAPAQDPPDPADAEPGGRALRRGEISRARQRFDDVVLGHEERAGDRGGPADDVALRARVGLMRILLR